MESKKSKRAEKKPKMEDAKKVEDEEEDEEEEEEDEDVEEDEVEKHEEKSEEEEDLNDVVFQFLKKVQAKKANLNVTVDALNLICDAKLEGDGPVCMSLMAYWAYGGLQLVWRDVLERLADPKYKPKTIKIEELKKTDKVGFFCCFSYKGGKLYADCVGKEWTVCMLDEK